MKRKPLKRTGSLRRITPLPRGGRLPFRSPKQARVYREVRVPLVKELLAEFPVCEVPWCTRPSADLHEVLRRSQGGSITDRDNIRVVCRFHNGEFANSAPQWAYELGFVRKRGPEDGAA